MHHGESDTSPNDGDYRYTPRRRRSGRPARAAAGEQGRRTSRVQTARSLPDFHATSVESTFAASGPPPPPRPAAMPLPPRCHCRRKGERQQSHEVDTPVVRVSHPNVSRARTRDTEPRPEPELRPVPSGAKQLVAQRGDVRAHRLAAVAPRHAEDGDAHRPRLGDEQEDAARGALRGTEHGDARRTIERPATSRLAQAAARRNLAAVRAGREEMHLIAE